MAVTGHRRRSLRCAPRQKLVGLQTWTEMDRHSTLTTSAQVATVATNWRATMARAIKLSAVGTLFVAWESANVFTLYRARQCFGTDRRPFFQKANIVCVTEILQYRYIFCYTTIDRVRRGTGTELGGLSGAEKLRFWWTRKSWIPVGPIFATTDRNRT